MKPEQLGWTGEEESRDQLIKGVLSGRIDLLLRSERAYPFAYKLKAQYIVECAATGAKHFIIDPNDPEVPLDRLAEHILKQLSSCD